MRGGMRASPPKAWFVEATWSRSTQGADLLASRHVYDARVTTVRVERTGPGGCVARVTLTRPEVHNAFNATVIAELRAIFTSLARESPTELRAVVLAGD